MAATWALLALAWLEGPEPAPPQPPAAPIKIDVCVEKGEAAPALRSAPPAPLGARPERELWQMTLPEAIRIGLDNSKVLRVIALEHDAKTPHCVVAPFDAEADPWKFKAEVMAQVRSIEQSYWSLAQQHVQLWASEKAVELAREILQREEGELKAGRSNASEVAEAKQRLEQFSLDLVTRTSDVLTTERQLRNILGLPATDNRRIVPTTAPVESKVDPSWDASLAAMQKQQPDLVQSKETAEQSKKLARGLAGVLASLDANVKPDSRIVALERQLKSEAERQQAFVEQVLHQTTHSLARFFLEVDANYKQFKTASKMRAAAAQRLEAQRAFYEEGRIPIDRFLDAVSQYASALAQEAQFRATYNIALTAFEEAKGTLLDARGIQVGKTPQQDSAVKPTSLETAPKAAQPGCCEKAGTECAAEACAKPAADGRTLRFHVTIGGVRPVEVKGSVSIEPSGARTGHD